MTYFALLLLLAQSSDFHRIRFEAWLQGEATKLWDARDAAIQKLDTKASVEARQRYVLETARELIGGLPTTKSPLNARVTSSFNKPGYRVENVVFESQPGFRVTANLYLPTDRPGPFPAVLGVAGHSVNGKASSTYQRAFIGFVRRGIAVLAYDPPGQGERLEYMDEKTGKSRPGVGVAEHQTSGVPTLLVGWSIARHFIWDGVRAVDYLLTRPEIDPKRIAVAGNSGGGTQAAYLAMFEPRLANVISSCYMTRWRELWPGPGPQDAEQTWPGFLERGLDFGDFALALAPRPYLITSAIRDYFPIDGARATHRQTTRLFDLLGQGANLGFFDYDDTHGWSQPRREAAARWLDRHFFGKETDGREAPVEAEEESRLYATPTGQLADSLSSRTTRELALEEAIALRKQRGPATVDSIRKAIGYVAPTGGLEVLLESKPAAAPREIWLVVGARLPEADYASLVKEGKSVYTVFPRGTSPDGAKIGASGYALDYQTAARAWLLGRNLPALNAADIATAVSHLKQQHPGLPVHVYARGQMAPAALLAGVLDMRIGRVAVDHAWDSWEALLAAPLQQGNELSIVPGVLRHFDLPDLRRLLGTRLLEVSPVDPTGRPIRTFSSERKVILRGEDWPLERVLRD